MAIEAPRRSDDAHVEASASPDAENTTAVQRFRSSVRSWAAEAARAGSLSDGLSGRHNALGSIRFILAAAVIVSHGFPLSGAGEDPVLAWSRGQQNLGGFAVIGFFAISGYLIAKSGTRNDILQYAWARILRIFPAFLVVLGLSAFVIGPICWMLMGRGLGSYLTLGPGGPFAYITGNWTLRIHQWGIHDIFSNTPYGSIVDRLSVFNGSLWTLAYEWTCYVLIGVFVLFGVLSRIRILVPIVTLALFGMQVARLSGTNFAAVVPWLGDQSTVSLGLIFMIGATFALYADRIILDYRLALLCMAVTVYTAREGAFEIFGYPAFAYALFWIGSRAPAVFKRWGSRNDYSYGIYVWGFLVQQILAGLAWYRWGYLPYVGLSLVFSIGLAWLSWHGVEKRALAIKGWGPGLGVRYWWDALRAVPARWRHASSHETADLAQERNA